MNWMAAPSAYPSTNDYLEGDIRSNATGDVVGRMTMGWVSEFYRKATIEIDMVKGSDESDRPHESDDGHNWTSIMSSLGWDVTIDESDIDVARPPGDTDESWSDAEMHDAMLQRRDKNDLDAEWRYHLLIVKFLDSTFRGIMYDSRATDSNRVPREGVGMSSHWIIDGPEPWGRVKGMQFSKAKNPYFRTAIHEIGHAMGLYHNTATLGFMNTSDVIARSATAARPFPDNIDWTYAEDDYKRLRHYPDVYVRPGGAAFGSASITNPPITPTDEFQQAKIQMPGLELKVQPMLTEVPIGAPVRINLELTNTSSDTPLQVPDKISLKSDVVHGTVHGPTGSCRGFSPLIICHDDKSMRSLAKGENVTSTLVLLRGQDGALFPTSGVHEITVEVSWEAYDMAGVQFHAVGKTTVFVTGAQTPKHAEAAHKILTTPDAHLVLVLGGCSHQLTDGIKAIQAALADDTLRPHFAVIEAKRLAMRFQDQTPDLDNARKLVQDRGDIFCSVAEAEKLEDLGVPCGARKME
ncbi:hypothetical protein H2198_005717 [Neophaeococcomyces mojaviensis]|uniref:Uncharacterized protein n=1 Tax=Neophaeococcomyces mojaviensis TaxID=3383035 RepID=A0ACC3A516_9EURO|nr:hypothetical protein H2198_005717 [Knufia sp. JES_112]